MTHFKLVPIMTQSDLPAFSVLNDALAQTKLKTHASQAHGLVCGLICGDPIATMPRWQQLVLGDDAAEMPVALKDMYEVTARQLKEFLFEFELALPPDDAPLPDRAEALAEWCQGFLTGLKLVNVPIEEREPGDTTEAINDIIEIAKMEHEAVVANEEDEVVYVELVEFLRMAVITIYQELREAEEPKQSRSRHH